MEVKKEKPKTTTARKTAKKEGDKAPTQTTIKKTALLNALEKSMGVVSSACRMIGIERTTHYDWMKADPVYKKKVESIQDIVLDFAESSLHKQIKEGNTTATIFLLKCKGKSRGYIDKEIAPDTTDKNQFELVNIES